VSPRRNRRHQGEEPSANLVNTIMASDLVNPCRHRGEDHQRTEITSPPGAHHGHVRSGERIGVREGEGREREMHDLEQRGASEQRSVIRKMDQPTTPRFESHR
jgi:hypothetical protein